MCSSISSETHHSLAVAGVNIALLTKLAEIEETFEEPIVRQINLIETETKKINKIIKTTRKQGIDQTDRLKKQFIQYIDTQIDEYISAKKASQCGLNAIEKIKALETCLDDACLTIKVIKGHFKLSDLYVPRTNCYFLNETLKNKDNR